MLSTGLWLWPLWREWRHDPGVEMSTMGDDPQRGMTELIQVLKCATLVMALLRRGWQSWSRCWRTQHWSWPSSEEDDRVDPGVEVRNIGHDLPQNRITELIQVLKCASLAMTLLRRGWQSWSRCHDPPQKRMTELIQVSWPSSEEDDRVYPGVMTLLRRGWQSLSRCHDPPQKKMTEFIQVSWPFSEEYDRVDPGVEVRHVGHDPLKVDDRVDPGVMTLLRRGWQSWSRCWSAPRWSWPLVGCAWHSQCPRRWCRPTPIYPWGTAQTSALQNHPAITKKVETGWILVAKI